MSEWPPESDGDAQLLHYYLAGLQGGAAPATWHAKLADIAIPTIPAPN